MKTKRLSVALILFEIGFKSVVLALKTLIALSASLWNFFTLQAVFHTSSPPSYF